MDALTQTNTNSQIPALNNQQFIDQDACGLNSNMFVDHNEPLQLTQGVDALSAPISPPKALTSTPPTIKYAPVITPVKGTYNLFCLALKWLDNPGPSLSSVTNDGHNAASVYKRLSNGYITFNVIPKEVSVNFTHSAKNVAAAEAYAKKVATVNNNYPNIYVIFNHGARSVSTGGGDTAHLIGTLYRDVLHEVGHCRPFNLGHSGKFDANGKYLQYDDGTSFMGRFSSADLTAPQLYYLGWLPQNKVAEYDIGTPATEYNIENLDAPNTGDNLKAVLIPNPSAKNLFLSMPKVNNQFMFALHLANHTNSKKQSGGGSERVQVFANTAEYDNLLFEKVSVGSGYTTVRISPKP